MTTSGRAPWRTKSPDAVRLQGEQSHSEGRQDRIHRQRETAKRQIDRETDRQTD